MVGMPNLIQNMLDSVHIEKNVHVHVQGSDSSVICGMLNRLHTVFPADREVGLQCPYKLSKLEALLLCACS